MSQFYASIKGGRGGEATRIGTKNSGLEGHIRGWDSGVRVVAAHEDGKDVFYVYRTKGSNATGLHSGRDDLLVKVS